MLIDNLDAGELLNLKSQEIGPFCDGLLDAGALAEEVDVAGSMSRKDLCEFLDIGESTLSGWLKEKRVPRMAKAAIVLSAAVGVLQAEIRRLRAESADLRVARDGDTYVICRFKEDKDGQVIGDVIARGIRDINHARLLSTAIGAHRLLLETRRIINDKLDSLEDDPFLRDTIQYFERVRDKITALHLLAFDFDKWRQGFGKDQHSGLDLDLDPREAGAEAGKSTTTGATADRT